MKLIKKGPGRRQEFQVGCPHCFSILQYNIQDRKENSKGEGYIECLVCPGRIKFGTGERVGCRPVLTKENNSDT